ncbi:hypothetical protein RFI_06298 [Reticulomyxa filosa]|uniref:Uncharacterized protein n=1 Tax=Reticulomyxa filosa TaxID=46433 RepID=X6NY74_RETFI|nr:hypothetical protein RFI_06298 [Reticulomyxa filosa]|eukprot:ETO30823.1 hypothetical protein RFI_06298 [Reticulomyxa filosa]
MTNDDNFSIDPSCISMPLKQTKTMGKQKLEDDGIDAALNVGITEKERKLVKRYHTNNQFQDWDHLQLLSPKKKRLLHKLDVLRSKTEKLSKRQADWEFKQLWLVRHTHKHGIIGMDTPLYQHKEMSHIFCDEIEKKNDKCKLKSIAAELRKQTLSEKTSVNSGILYHLPHMAQCSNIHTNFQSDINKKFLKKRKRRTLGIFLLINVKQHKKRIMFVLIKDFW